MQAGLQQNISKYLALYAEPEAGYLDTLSPSLSAVFKHCLVLPCYDETIGAIERLANHRQAQKTLLIAVINAPDNGLCAAAENRANTALFQQLVGTELTGKHLNLFLTQLKSLTVLVVDRFTIGSKIHPKKGVGLARKIGCDIACRLWQLGKLSQPIIYSSDADAHLPENYFQPLPDCVMGQDIGAYVFDFAHQESDSDVAKATQDYEKSIKYYRDGLAFAHSPYAFFSLGSCLAIHIASYCQVRGFPARAGGEDFYLLNKIAKIAAVHFVPAIKISIEARLSHRVPFGTGPAVQRIVDANEALSSYNPYIFIQLATLLSWASHSLPELILAQQAPLQPREYRLILQSIPHLSRTSCEALDTLNVGHLFRHMHKQCNSKKHIIEHFQTWFDALKTLKFVHFLQQHDYPPCPLDEGIKALDAFTGSTYEPE